MIDTTAQDTGSGVGLAEALLRSIVLSPNPTAGPLTIGGLTGKQATVTVFDASGALVRQRQLLNRQLDLGALPAGTYFLSIEVGEATVRRMVVIR